MVFKNLFDGFVCFFEINHRSIMPIIDLVNILNCIVLINSYIMYCIVLEYLIYYIVIYNTKIQFLKYCSIVNIHNMLKIIEY